MSHHEKLKRMIEERRIEEAFKEYNEKIEKELSKRLIRKPTSAERYADTTLRKCAFYAGAKWMQEEFLKNLWHPASEEPREFAEVLAEAKITESIKTYLSFKRNDSLFKNWDAYSSGANITRWLYINDLF